MLLIKTVVSLFFFSLALSVSIKKKCLSPITSAFHAFSVVLWEYSRHEELLKSSKAGLRENAEAGLDKIQDLMAQ